jgi:hypothetical protein
VSSRTAIVNTKFFLIQNWDIYFDNGFDDFDNSFWSFKKYRRHWKKNLLLSDLSKEKIINFNFKKMSFTSLFDQNAAATPGWGKLLCLLYVSPWRKINYSRIHVLDNLMFKIEEILNLTLAPSYFMVPRDPSLLLVLSFQSLIFNEVSFLIIRLGNGRKDPLVNRKHHPYFELGTGICIYVMPMYSTREKNPFDMQIWKTF